MSLKLIKSSHHEITFYIWAFIFKDEWHIYNLCIFKYALDSKIAGQVPNLQACGTYFPIDNPKLSLIIYYAQPWFLLTQLGNTLSYVLLALNWTQLFLSLLHVLLIFHGGFSPSPLLSLIALSLEIETPPMSFLPSY